METALGENVLSMRVHHQAYSLVKFILNISTFLEFILACCSRSEYCDYYFFCIVTTYFFNNISCSVICYILLTYIV
jgi:hypothetical protein